MKHAKPRYTTRHKRWICALLVVAAAVSIPMGIWTVIGYRSEMALRASDSRACAEIDEHRAVNRSEHMVRYHFEVAGERFTHSDATGRSNLWADISEADSERVEIAGCVEVVFLAEDPSVNRPASWSSLNNPLANKLGAALMVLVTLLLCGGGIQGIRKVARTPLWRITRMDTAHVVLGCDGEEQSIPRSTLRRSVLLELPRTMQHPPWRFPCDVLLLRTTEETWAVAARGPHWGTLVESLQRAAKLKRKRSA
ncbi:MAG: hypothetical protein AB8H86_27495 [Polyangiales bacterium]